MTDARARLDSDEELAEWFEGREEKSATVRDALRLLMAREAGYGRLAVISGIGARQYYKRKLGYHQDGPYVVKRL